MKDKGIKKALSINLDKALFTNNNEITLEGLFNSLPIKDFCWAVINSCELSSIEKKQLVLHCAEFVAPLYRQSFPKDNRVDDCLQATKDFLSGKTSKEILIKNRDAAADASNTAGAYAVYGTATSAAYTAACSVATAAATAMVCDAITGKNAALGTLHACKAVEAVNMDDKFKKHVWKFIETL